MRRGAVTEYVADLIHWKKRYPCAWTKPSVYLGYFKDDSKGCTQKETYGELLRAGYRRTPWQLVFPGQVAGLVKRLEKRAGQPNEFHIRFFEDGMIDCEFEVDRFQIGHWSGHRLHGIQVLEKILATDLGHLSQKKKERLLQQWSPKLQFVYRMCEGRAS